MVWLYLFNFFTDMKCPICLFEAAYEEILTKCNCTPSFHLTAFKEYPRICSGTRLRCMTSIIHGIGKYNTVSTKALKSRSIKLIPFLMTFFLIWSLFVFTLQTIDLSDSIFILSCSQSFSFNRSNLREYQMFLYWRGQSTSISSL